VPSRHARLDRGGFGQFVIFCRQEAATLDLDSLQPAELLDGLRNRGATWKAWTSLPHPTRLDTSAYSSR